MLQIISRHGFRKWLSWLFSKKHEFTMLDPFMFTPGDYVDVGIGFECYLVWKVKPDSCVLIHSYAHPKRENILKEKRNKA